jgi:cell division protein FtsB
MDNQYYRKARPKVTGWLTKTLKNRNVLLSLLVIVPATSFVTFSNKGILQRVSLESQKHQIEEKILHAQEEQTRLREQSRALDSDPRAIENVARERYGMIREGETVYRVKKDK